MTWSSWKRGPEGTGQAGEGWPCVPERCKGFRKEGRKTPAAHRLGPAVWAKSTLRADEAQTGGPQIGAAGSEQFAALCALSAPAWRLHLSHHSFIYSSTG